MSHSDEREREALIGCAVSVLELTNNEVVGGSRHWPCFPKLPFTVQAMHFAGSPTVVLVVQADMQPE